MALVDTRLERWAEAFAHLPSEVQTVRTHAHAVHPAGDRRLVVNPGSVGMPYSRPGGSWGLLREGVVTLRRTEIDVYAAIKRILADSEHPDRQA